ncbi:hypothetical protein TNCV_733601 [Trichonephila clavipes]|nr:hypothetical protein TNCV_733601 [Trichonephila clavipes]
MPTQFPRQPPVSKYTARRGLGPIEEWFPQIRPSRSDYTSRVTFVSGTYFTSKRDSEIARGQRATPTQRHDLTPTVSPIPIALPASVPPALFQLVSTPPSSGANITACNKTLSSQQYSCGSLNRTKPQQSNSGAVQAPPDLKFSDYKVVENGDGVDEDETVNNIPSYHKIKFQKLRMKI